MTLRVLLTGATGFVGGQVIRDLQTHDVEMYALVRSEEHNLPAEINIIQIDSIERYSGENLPDSLDVIVHLVAKAHVTEHESDREEYVRVNVEGTKALAKVAIDKGASHFIYMSSIKAAGDFPASGTLSESDISKPLGVYGETKWQAEQVLASLSQNAVKVSVIRPPLVYGKGVKANMAALMQLVRWFPILPFGAINNKRSLISVRNLSDFVMTLLFVESQKKYQNECFIVADNDSLSTTQLCRYIARGLNKRIWVLNVPQPFLNLCMKVTGLQRVWNKLTGNAEVCALHPKKYFNWQAPYESADEIIEMVRGMR